MASLYNSKFSLIKMDTNVQSVYDQWARSYDEIENKTRDLDRIATQLMLAEIISSSKSVLEFGCGTGKNTSWLINHAQHVTAVDFSEEMLHRAKEKTSASNLLFKQADISQTWPFEHLSFDLITCNLILEHVQDIDFVFSEAIKVLKLGGYFFISELHPFKQYHGSKARFEKDDVMISPDCYTHHISDFFVSATKYGFSCVELKEWFDNNDRTSIPRLISFLFKKCFTG
jgi:ubiquinone/menaquinone biosynthesis C-methylase UbiE